MSDKIIISFDIGIKNLAVCVLHVIDNTAEILIWKIIKLAAEKEKIPVMNELTGRLFLELDGLVDELDGKKVDTVLLENQPSRLNGSMKSLQMIIYSYFQLRKHWEGFVQQVLLVSASEKLKGHSEDKYPTIEPATQTLTSKQKKAQGYKNNKNMSVHITKEYIKEDSELHKEFCSYKKADDYGDSFLQCISWIHKHGYNINKVYRV
jgi:hypothetical protein